MSDLILGVVGTSTKENEKRVPIHPEHFVEIPEDYRKRIVVESGYGEPFGVEDQALRKLLGRLAKREELFATCDILLLPKPTEYDFPFFQEGQVLWGWPHCVQGKSITQVGIDKRMTYIAWESMHYWKDGKPVLHVFHKNNEMAGYCSVLHALSLCGVTGHYGPRLRAAVLSFGSTGRGAVYALQGMGITDITVFTQRSVPTVAAPIPGLSYKRYRRAGERRVEAMVGKEAVAMVDVLKEFDVIVNCILQDTDRPLDFLTAQEVELLKPGSLIVDVSCDTGMGFEFARPTSFEDPIFQVAGVTYYAVDHTPTYMWKAASYEISRALLPFITTVMDGPGSWQKEPVIEQAIEIRKGVICNPKILSFQNREKSYPHRINSQVVGTT